MIRQVPQPDARSRRPSGFTLVEVMTVITIIILLLGIGLWLGPELVLMFERSATRQVLRDLDAINSEYHVRTGQYIAAADTREFVQHARTVPDLMTLINKIDDDYLSGQGDNVQVLDAWGSPVIYRASGGGAYPNRNYYFMSVGHDGQAGNYAELQSQLDTGQTLSDTAKQAADNLYSFELTQ